MWSPLPSQLGTRNLELFLEHQGIERWRRELLVQDVIDAVCMYGQYSERCILRDDLEGVLKAAEKLKKAIPKLGTDRFVQLYAAFARTIPPSPPNFIVNKSASSLHGTSPDGAYKIPWSSKKGLTPRVVDVDGKKVIFGEDAAAWRRQMAELSEAKSAEPAASCP